jgi:hypothetical protein
MILWVYAISKKHLKTKRKTLFGLRLPGRKSIVFINRGKSPLFYKKQYQK